MSGIVVGVDGSGHSQRALEWAMNEAAIRHQPLSVLAVHHPADAGLDRRPGRSARTLPGHHCPAGGSRLTVIMTGGSGGGLEVLRVQVAISPASRSNASSMPRRISAAASSGDEPSRSSGMATCRWTWDPGGCSVTRSEPR